MLFRRRVYGTYRLDFFAPELDTDNHVVIGEINVYRVALHSEITPAQFYLVTGVQRIDEVSQ